MPTKPLAELEATVGDSRVTVEGLRVEHGKVAEFARAITDDDPLFRDGAAAGRRDDDRIPAPLTYTQVGRFPRYRPDGVGSNGFEQFDLGFQRERVLHGEQRYEYERPVVVGDVLDGTTTLVDVFQRGGRRGGTMTFAVLETEYRDRDGELVLTDRSTAIETEGTVDDGDDRDGSGDGDAPDPDGVERVRSVADLEVGETGPTVVVEDLERRHFVQYAGASGDFNRVHYDEPYARAAGSETVFGQGMFTAGIASRVVTGWFDIADVSRFGVRFQSRVFPGDTVVATGELVDVDRPTGTVEAALEATTADGETLLTGSATAELE